MIVFEQPIRLALAKQWANENFFIRHTFKQQFFVFRSCILRRPVEIFQTKFKSKQTWQKTNDFDSELEEDTVVNVADYITND